MPNLSKCDQGWAIQRKGESWKSRSDWGGNKVKQVDVISATWKKRWMTRKYLYTENMKANLSFAAMNLRKTFETSLLACCKKLKFRVITHKKYIFAFHKSHISYQVLFSILQLIDVNYWPINRIYSIPHEEVCHEEHIQGNVELHEKGGLLWILFFFGFDINS